MKYTITAFVMLLGFAGIFLAFSKQNEVHVKLSTTGAFEPVAVVELFTSQGCSSCPPADKLLAKTITNADGKKIFALSFHVDYWNRLGWKDPFSNALYSQRQAAYVQSLHTNGAYTPQIIVNGNTEFVGSDAGALQQALHTALAQKASIAFSNLAASLGTDNKITVAYGINGDFADKVVNIALLSIKETTQIKRGENEGITLNNENIVKEFLTKSATARGEVKFELPAGLSLTNSIVIAYVQPQHNGAIAGAAMAKF